MGYQPSLRDPDDLVRKVLGVLLTDSRSVYDKLQRPYISPTGESKRVDIELLTLKESQNELDLILRWVNSEAMLANSLTKRGEDQQMQRFIASQQLWRIVEDPEMFSGKRLKQMGRDLLDIERTETQRNWEGWILLVLFASFCCYNRRHHGLRKSTDFSSWKISADWGPCNSIAQFWACDRAYAAAHLSPLGSHVVSSLSSGASPLKTELYSGVVCIYRGQGPTHWFS